MKPTYEKGHDFFESQMRTTTPSTSRQRRVSRDIDMERFLKFYKFGKIDGGTGTECVVYYREGYTEFNNFYMTESDGTGVGAKGEIGDRKLEK